MKIENEERTTLTIPEVATMLGINEAAGYELAKQEGFPSLLVGRRIIVPRAAFERWLNDAAYDKRAYWGKYRKKSDFRT